MGIRKVNRKRRNGRARFKAMEGPVREALMAGWTVVAVWDAHGSRLSMSYAQFARYVQRMKDGTAKGSRGLGAHVSLKATPQARTMSGPELRRDGPEPARRRLNIDGIAVKGLNEEEAPD